MGSTKPKNCKLVKLDRRHSHRSLFTYMVQFRMPNGYQDYQQAIKYCNDQWGLSVDAETYNRIYHDRNRGPDSDFVFSREWSYLDRYGDHRIYLSDKAMNWVTLSNAWDL